MQMLRSRLFSGMVLAILAAMFWLDWNFPTPPFYTPQAPPGGAASNILLFKKTIELSLSLTLLAFVLFILLSKQSAQIARYLACAAIGAGIGFWLHRDLFFLLTH